MKLRNQTPFFYTIVHYVFAKTLKRDLGLCMPVCQCNKSPLLSAEPQKLTVQWGSSTVPFLEILAQFLSLPGGEAVSTPCQYLHLS